MILAKRKLVFTSSADRLSGSRGDFSLDIADALDDSDYVVHPALRSYNGTPQIRQDMCLVQANIPFRKESKGRVPRFPAVKDANGDIPAVNILRLHTDVPHENAQATSGCVTCFAQINFPVHFHQVAADSPFEFSYLHYEVPDTCSNGRFTITHGLKGMKNARFFITDDFNRQLLPAGDVHLTFSLETYTLDPVHKAFGLLDRSTRALDALLKMQRLQFLGTDPYVQSALRGGGGGGEEQQQQRGEERREVTDFRGRLPGARNRTDNNKRPRQG